MERDEQNPSIQNVQDSDKALPLVFLCFLVSGLAALIYELSWQRLLLRVLGSTLPAVTLVLCVFMAGLTLGCYVGGKFVHRVSKPLLAYGRLELLIGLFGLCSPWLFDSSPSSLVSKYDALMTNVFSLSNVNSFEPFNNLFLSRAIFATLLLLVPTVAMGATLPFVTKFLEQKNKNGQTQSTAYLFNLCGAALGALASGFLLMPLLGLTAAIFVASLLSLLIFGVMTLRFRESTSSAVETVSDSNTTLSALPICFAVLLNGAVSMTLEVVWARLFSLLVGNSTYSVASVFAVSIVGLAVGTAFARRLGTHIQSGKFVLALMFCITAACLYLDLWLIQLLPWIFNVNHKFFVGSNSFVGYLVERISVISFLVLPASIFCGSVFPLALREYTDSVGNRNGLAVLYTFSSLGSLLGSLCAGFLFVPLLGRMFASGMESTICLTIMVQLCFAIYLFTSFRTRRVFLIMPVVLSATLFFRPAWNKALVSSGIPFLSLPTKAATTKAIFDRVLSDSPNNRLLFYREGLNTTVTVSANIAQNVVYLKNDGKVEAALPFNVQRTADTSDLTTHFMLGKLPVSINRAPKKNVFVVGLGSGATCGAALDEPTVKKLKVAEIEPTIFEIQHYFEPANGEPTRPEWINKGKVVPFCGDARMSLNSSNEKYDVIVSQPAEPWISGSSDLYTREFWSLARAKLQTRGCFCQWIQLYAIDPEFLAVLLRTFQSVFPNTYIFHYPQAGEIIVLGTIEPLDEGMKNSYSSLIADPDQVRKWCLEIGETSKDFRLNTDDNLLTEYALPPRLYLSENLIDENLKSILSVR